MKKSAAALAALIGIACLPAWSLDWKLPVVSVRFETDQGQNEDSDDDTLQPSSSRSTVSLRLKESADPVALGLTLTGALKDYLQDKGDWRWLKCEHDASLRLGDSVRIGYTVGSRWMDYADMDSGGLSKDLVALTAGGDVTVTPVKGTSLEAGLDGRFAIANNPTDSRQTCVATFGVSSRLGEWLLGARYRGEFRFPLGSESGIGATANNTAAFSVQWDPNR
jgi:hypothetical protein